MGLTKCREAFLNRSPWQSCCMYSQQEQRRSKTLWSETSRSLNSKRQRRRRYEDIGGHEQEATGASVFQDRFDHRAVTPHGARHN